MAEKKASSKKAAPKKASDKPNSDKSKVGRPKEFGKVTDRDLTAAQQTLLAAAAARSGKTVDDAIVAFVRSSLSSRLGVISLSREIKRWSK